VSYRHNGNNRNVIGFVTQIIYLEEDNQFEGDPCYFRLMITQPDEENLFSTSISQKYTVKHFWDQNKWKKLGSRLVNSHADGPIQYGNITGGLEPPPLLDNLTFDSIFPEDASRIFSEHVGSSDATYTSEGFTLHNIFENLRARVDSIFALLTPDECQKNALL